MSDQSVYTYESPKPSSGLAMDDFDYELPSVRIAQTPAEPRDSARLLVADGPAVGHHTVRDLPAFIRAGDVIVLNETKVLPARLKLTKATGGAVEVLLVELVDAVARAWHGLVRPSRKIAVGQRIPAGEGLTVEIGERVDGGLRVVRLLDPATGGPLAADAEDAALLRHGVLPLPPYITTPLGNPDRYQTTYASLPGSAAAPTAGLHLTPELLDTCRERGAAVHTVELRVGLDTFRPVSADRPEDHEIHSEHYRVPETTLRACRSAREQGGRVVAVGTTSVRALESAAASGHGEGRTRLFIYGDYEFQVVDALLTNFHLPRSSLLLLVHAFIGERWRAIYDEAQREGYRFLSFGDAMFLTRR